jgi:tetratricopeptide (TPR) repeat protein
MHMDNQLALLQEIRSGVWILIYLVGAGVVVNIFKTVAASYKTIKSELSNVFYNYASSMFDAGKYEELIAYCHERIKKKPRDAYAFWFLGKAYFHMKDFDKAVENFDKVVEIYPSWKNEWVGPYMAQIESQRNSPVTSRSI